MNMYKGLLFLQGHLLHDDDLASEAANDAGTAAREAKPGRAFNALESMLFLGGRPMHPDQPYDREEPFDQLLAGKDARDIAPASRCA